jgi:ABC-2 type transport system permease protein
MLANVFTKTISDRWRGWLIALVSLGLMFLLALDAYRSIDLGVYSELPIGFRSILGIPETADVASLAVNALVSSYGAFILAAMALALGSAAVAGEEREGTIGLLLANPLSRARVLLDKTAAMVALTVLGVVALWATIVGSAAWLDVSLEGLDVIALSVHLLANSLFYGFIALAVGAWTGNRSAAVGASVGLMVASFFAVGILPLVEGTEGWEKASPWYYFDGSDPLLNGIEWGHVVLLLVVSLVLGAAAVIGLRRRDLKGQSVGETIFDRLRAHPLFEKVVGRLAGAARVSSIWVKTASEYQGMMWIVAVYTFLVQGVLMGPLYGAMPRETFVALEDFPEVMLALFGGGDPSTAEGFYQLETFGMMAPALVLSPAIAIGAGALAGEESRRTMGLLLANPIARSRIIVEKTLTMVLLAVAVGVVTFAGVWAGSLIGGLGMDVGNIAAACVLQVLVGLVFGALALALSAATGRKKVAIFGAVGAGVALHLLNSFGDLSETMADWAMLSPFRYYLGSDPLMTGMHWGDAAILGAISVVLIAASFWLFQRRDLRQGS